MKKAFRYLLIILGIIVLAAGAFAAFIGIRGVPKYAAARIDLNVTPNPQRIEKGRKLASMLCAGCHLDPNTGKFTGHRMDEVPQFGTIYSKNITQDPVHGIGKWTDGEIAYLLRTGIKPDGTFLPIMAKLSHASDEDIHSIIAFLRSDHPWVKADNTTHPQSDFSFLSKFLCNIGAMKPAAYPTAAIPEPDTTNTVQWGRYIAVAQLECYSCHSQDFAKNNYAEPEKSAGYFGGGNEMLGPDGKKIRTLNITMDEETGIGKWTEEDFIKAVKYGQVPGGQKQLRPPMMSFANLSDNEVRAIYAYLKTVPKISNKVERGVK